MVLNIGQSQSRVTELADDSCGKMAPQKVVRGAGMGDWQGVSSHALRRVTVNQVPAKHQQVGDTSPITGLQDLVISSPK